MSSFKYIAQNFFSWRKRDAEGGEQSPLPKSHKAARQNEEHLAKIRELLDADNSIFAREVRDALVINCAPDVKSIGQTRIHLKKRVVSK